MSEILMKEALSKVLLVGEYLTTLLDGLEDANADQNSNPYNSTFSLKPIKLTKKEITTRFMDDYKLYTAIRKRLKNNKQSKAPKKNIAESTLGTSIESAAKQSASEENLANTSFIDLTVGGQESAHESKSVQQSADIVAKKPVLHTTTRSATTRALISNNGVTEPAANAVETVHIEGNVEEAASPLEDNVFARKLHSSNEHNDDRISVDKESQKVQVEDKKESQKETNGGREGSESDDEIVITDYRLIETIPYQDIATIIQLATTMNKGVTKLDLIFQINQLLRLTSFLQRCGTQLNKALNSNTSKHSFEFQFEKIQLEQTLEITNIQNDMVVEGLQKKVRKLQSEQKEETGRFHS